MAVHSVYERESVVFFDSLKSKETAPLPPLSSQRNKTEGHPWSPMCPASLPLPPLNTSQNHQLITSSPVAHHGLSTCISGSEQSQSALRALTFDPCIVQQISFHRLSFSTLTKMCSSALPYSLSGNTSVSPFCGWQTYRSFLDVAVQNNADRIFLCAFPHTHGHSSEVSRCGDTGFKGTYFVSSARFSQITD